MADIESKNKEKDKRISEAVEKGKEKDKKKEKREQNPFLGLPTNPNKATIYIGTHNIKTDISYRPSSALGGRVYNIIKRNLEPLGIIPKDNWGSVKEPFRTFEKRKDKVFNEPETFNHKERTDESKKRVSKWLSTKGEKYAPLLKNVTPAEIDQTKGKIAKESAIKELEFTKKQLEKQAYFSTDNKSFIMQLTSSGINQLEDKNVPSGGLALGKGFIPLTLPVLALLNTDVRNRLKRYMVTLSDDVNDTKHLNFSNLTEEDDKFFKEMAQRYGDDKNLNDPTQHDKRYRQVGMEKTPFDTLSSAQVVFVSKIPTDIYSQQIKINNAMAQSFNADFDGDPAKINNAITDFIKSLNTNLSQRTLLNIYSLQQTKRTIWNKKYGRRYETINNLTPAGKEKESEIERSLLEAINGYYDDETKTKIGEGVYDMMMNLIDTHKEAILEDSLDSLEDYEKHKEYLRDVFKNFNETYENIIRNYDQQSANFYTDPNKEYFDWTKDEEKPNTTGGIRKVVDEEGIKAITIAPNPNIEIDTEHTIFDKPYAPFHLYPEFYSSVATQPRKTALMKYFKNQLVFGYAEEALTRAGLLTKEQVEAIKNTYREKNIRMSSGGEMISGLDSAEGQIDATVFTGFPRIDLEAYRQELAKTKTKVDTSLRAPSIFTDKYTEEDAFIDTAIRAHGTDNQTLDQDVYGALGKKVLARNNLDAVLKEVKEGENKNSKETHHDINILEQSFAEMMEGITDDPLLSTEEKMSNLYLVDNLKTKKQLPALKNEPDLDYNNPLKRNITTKYLSGSKAHNDKNIFKGLNAVVPFTFLPKALEQYLPKNKNYDFATNEGVINYNKAILKALGKHIAATPIKTTAEKPINIAEHLEKNRLGKFLYLSTQSFFSQFPKRVNNTSGTASPHMTNKDYQKAYDMAFDTRYWGMPFLDSFEKIRHQPEEQGTIKDKMTEVGFKVAGKPIMRSADDEKEDKFRKKLPMTTNIDLTKQINVPMNLIPSGSYEAEATAKNLIDWSKTLINNFETVSKILLHNEYIATLPNATPAELKNKKPDYPDVVTLYNKDFLNNVIKGGTLNQNKNEYPQNKTINFVLNVLSRSPKMLSEKSNENINNKNYNLSRKTSQEYLYDFLHTLHGGGTIATHINKNYEQFFDAAFLPGQYGIPSSIGFDEILGTDKKYETISTEHPLFSQTNLEIKYRPTNIAGQQTAGISSIKEAVSSKPERGIDYYHRKGRGNRFPVSNTKIDRPDIMTSYDFGNIKSLYQQSKDVVEKIISTEYLSGRKTKEQVLEQVKNTPKLTGAYYKSENYDKSNNKLPSKKDLFETTFTEKIASRVPALGVSEISMRNQDVNVSAQNPYFKAMMKYVNVSKEHYETNGFFDKKKLGKSVNSVTNLFGEFGNVVGTDGEKRVKFILKDKSLVDAKYHGIYDKLSTRFKELDEDLDSLSNDEVNAVSNIVGNKDKKH